MWLYCACAKAFPNLNEEADNLWHHSMTSLLYCWCKLRKDMKGGLTQTWGWFSLARVQFRSVLVWEGYRLSAPANSVPLEEWEYKHTGKCSLFVHPSCTHPRLAWTPLVSFVELLVCQPGVRSPCDNQTWNQKGKDHYCLEQNHGAGINCDFSETTKHMQCLPVTFLASLGGHEACSSRGLVWQPCAVAVNDHPWWFDKADEYLLPGQKCPSCLQRSPLVVIKWISNSPWIRCG